MQEGKPGRARGGPDEGRVSRLPGDVWPAQSGIVKEHQSWQRGGGGGTEEGGRAELSSG